MTITDESNAREPLRSGALYRPVCDLLECRYPLVLAGMGGVSRSELVCAVSEAGGFGLLGMVREPVDLIRREVEKVRSFTSRPFGVSIIPAATPRKLLDEQVTTCIQLKVPVVSLFWDLSQAIIGRFREAGTLVMCQIGSAEEAVLAERSGAQVLIAQGREAGGHVRGNQPLADLLADVLAKVDIPVLAAGGMADGQDVANMLSLGAQGAVLGTALLATQESFAHDFHKDAIVDSRDGDTILTHAFHINWPPDAQVRVLQNSVTRGERGDPFGHELTPIGREADRPIYLFSTDSPLRTTTGDLEAMALYAGEGAARIRHVLAAGERIEKIAAEAAAALFVRTDSVTEKIEFASPVCYANELEAAYVDLADDDEVIGALNELLEAERAGARVSMELARETDDDALRTIARGIWKDEVKWCGVLIRGIQACNAVPSTRTGEFYNKLMAIPDRRKRLEFLNRGQSWVVRKLESLTPRLREERLQNELAEMLRSHRLNIAGLDDYLRG